MPSVRVIFLICKPLIKDLYSLPSPRFQLARLRTTPLPLASDVLCTTPSPSHETRVKQKKEKACRMIRYGSYTLAVS